MFLNSAVPFCRKLSRFHQTETAILLCFDFHLKRHFHHHSPESSRSVTFAFLVHIYILFALNSASVSISSIHQRHSNKIEITIWADQIRRSSIKNDKRAETFRRRVIRSSASKWIRPATFNFIRGTGKACH